MSVLPIIFDDKVDTPEIVAILQQFGVNKYVNAALINLYRDAINELHNNKAPIVNGLIPSQYLPSYVDDVVEFANLAAFPSTGESGKIYVALDTNLTYRWSGSFYLLIGGGKKTHRFSIRPTLRMSTPNINTWLRNDINALFHEVPNTVIGAGELPTVNTYLFHMSIGIPYKRNQVLLKKLIFNKYFFSLNILEIAIYKCYFNSTYVNQDGIYNITFLGKFTVDNNNKLSNSYEINDVFNSNSGLPDMKYYIFYKKATGWVDFMWYYLDLEFEEQ